MCDLPHPRGFLQVEGRSIQTAWRPLRQDSGAAGWTSGLGSEPQSWSVGALGPGWVSTPPTLTPTMHSQSDWISLKHCLWALTGGLFLCEATPRSQGPSHPDHLLDQQEVLFLFGEVPMFLRDQDNHMHDEELAITSNILFLQVLQMNQEQYFWTKDD